MSTLHVKALSIACETKSVLPLSDFRREREREREREGVRVTQPKLLGFVEFCEWQISANSDLFCAYVSEVRVRMKSLNGGAEPRIEP